MTHSFHPDPDTPIDRLRNLGPKSRQWLAEAGIHTFGELRELGALNAYRRVLHLRPRDATRNLLFALQASLMGMDWRDLPAEIKADLDRRLTGP